MLTSSFITRASACFPTVCRRLEKLATGVALTAALSLVVQSLTHPANGSEIPGTMVAPVAQATPVTARSLPDGTYLYGQATKADQIGSTYLVFNVNKGKVVGGFYMPQSSFDCFHGTVEADQLALTIVDSYEQSSYPYAVALQTQSISASAGRSELVPVGLTGYHAITRLGAVDRKILSTCKANFHQS